MNNKTLPSFLLNSNAFDLELQVILGTAFMAMCQASLNMGSKSSWKPEALVSFTAMVTSSMAHSARWVPESKGEELLTKG